MARCMRHGFSLQRELKTVVESPRGLLLKAIVHGPLQGSLPTPFLRFRTVAEWPDAGAHVARFKTNRPHSYIGLLPICSADSQAIVTLQRFRGLAEV